MSTYEVCTICLDEMIPRDGSATLCCGHCNNKIHLKCYKHNLNCPLCSKSYNYLNISKIKIFDSGNLTNIIELDRKNKDLTVFQIILESAKLLDNINNNNLLSEDLSQLLLSHDNKDCHDYTKNILSSDTKELSIKIVDGRKCNIKKLREANYNLLANFFESKSINVDSENLYNISLILELVIKLIQPSVTRTISIIDDALEEEIYEVLIDAYTNNRSAYEAIIYEFF